jgi:hypothetical protein
MDLGLEGTGARHGRLQWHRLGCGVALQADLRVEF